MRAISLQQPMGWAIFHAQPRKDIENRTTLVIPRNFRGRIAIHASARTPNDVWDDYAWFIDDVTGRPPPGGLSYTRKPARPRPDPAMVFGAILGTVAVVGVVTEHDSPWFTGPIGYVLDDPRPLREPVRCKGSLGLWVVPPDVEAAISGQL